MFCYIPLWETRVQLYDGLRTYLGRGKYVEIDGMGVLVQYASEEGFSLDKVRKAKKYRHHHTFCVIEADSVEQAIRYFYEDYQGANVGGETIQSKALRINRTRRIIVLPHCHLLNVGKKEGRFICGPQNKYINFDGGLYGDCVLQGADYPSGYCGLKSLPGNVRMVNFSSTVKATAKKIKVEGITYRYVDLNK